MNGSRPQILRRLAVAFAFLLLAAQTASIAHQHADDSLPSGHRAQVCDFCAGFQAGAPIATDSHRMAQPASVLSGDALTLELAPTIGETVAREPGVHSTFFGPAASRPVIRGLGGDRVQVLTDGLATLDASGVSHDHAVAVDPALADQVEVLHGPSTLLYGSGAASGLVNVVTNRLHDRTVDGTLGLVE